MNSQPHYHPDEALLIEFAAGTLPPAQAMAINAHLHYCHECRCTLRNLEAVGGAMLMNKTESTDDWENSFNNVLKRIDAESETPSNRDKPTYRKAAIDNKSNSKHKHLPKVIQKILNQQKLQWKSVTNSLKTAPLFIGQKQFALSLQKINAGGRVPEHDHRGEEFTVVLKGSFSDEDGIYREGDFISRQPGDTHRPTASRNEDCLCLSVEEAPVKLTGLRGWIFNPFLKIQTG